MCVYKIVMRNGKEYIIKSENANVVSFMTDLIKRNSYTDYKLNVAYEEKGIKFNTVMINSEDVSTVEYYTNQ